MMEFYPKVDQYVLHRNKVPCDVRGQNIDPHSPVNWISLEAAIHHSTGHFGIGFVLTENDPYFVIDLDNCRDSGSGNVTEYAWQWIDAMPGALLEVSQSGRGLHIWGTCDQGITKTHMNRTENYEIYTRNRFIALGYPCGVIAGIHQAIPVRPH